MTQEQVEEKDEIAEFVGEFVRFRSLLMDGVTKDHPIKDQASFEGTVCTLFAIYHKNRRTTEMTEKYEERKEQAEEKRASEPATSGQVNALRRLFHSKQDDLFKAMQKRGVEKAKFEALTKAVAGDIIKEVTKGGEDWGDSGKKQYFDP